MLTFLFCRGTYYMLENLKELIMGGRKFLPIFEGGKGIGISTGITAGHFACSGCVGTFSGVNPDLIDGNGKTVRVLLKARTRLERHLEMIQNSINGIISHAKTARDIASNFGRIHMNVLWEMGGTEKILVNTLSKLKGVVQGVACGAGLPYKLGDICAKFRVNYLPIVSSLRAFRVLWKKSYERTKEWLGAVIYECPWRAGGHNGFTHAENPAVKGNTYERVKELRSFMNEAGLRDIPVVVAGGVWNLKEYEHFLNNPDIGDVAFQFGTRPLLTRESPISDEWKNKLLKLSPEDIKLNNFSPTGFYSLAINNVFLKELFDRSARQIVYSDLYSGEFNSKFKISNGSTVFIRENDLEISNNWFNGDHSVVVKTPEGTILFLRPDEFEDLKKDIRECSGCLSQCQFSCWQQSAKNYSSGRIPDFRKMCIQKALQNAKNNENTPKQLYFAGSEAYRFATDPMYKNGYIPTISELVKALLDGR
ncbi:MAG: nitronate monooxygenase [Rickettsiales bacterium]|jgi:NAD(P)H-dependent flavin oxidoreductase YrpB (nitropropane dioxygenase family)|nr:nitronate monooxygenase [Rickettsiales bacterium]